MRRRSFTLLFSGGLLLFSWCAVAHAARPARCLPPIFEAGRRLHELPTLISLSPRWLEILLRQHEICWRVPDHEKEVRVVLAGNSAIFGFPLLVEDTVGALLNEDFTAQHIAAHVFNLGFIFTYALKDALIVHESLPYQPDVIIYGVTLADFLHAAPADTLLPFFESNSRELIRFAEERPSGLADPAEIYRSVLNRWPTKYSGVFPITELGGLLRAVVRHHAESVRRYFFPDYVDPWIQTEGRRTYEQPSNYDCAKTKRDFAQWFRDWQAWNIFAYLQQVRETTGIEVMIVNWPVEHNPVDDCYSIRYPTDGLRQYTEWIQRETGTRGLRYLDLHDLLPLDDFVDTLHIGPAGHRKIAARIEPALEALLMSIRRRPPATPR